MKNLSPIVKYVLLHLDVLQIEYLLAHISDIANSAVSFSGVVISLKYNEASSIYFLPMFPSCELMSLC